MHYLPRALFGSKDHRSPQSDRGNILPSTNLGLFSHQLHNVDKLKSYVLHYALKASDLAVSDSAVHKG